MIEVRPAATLGSTRREGIKAIHHFCFAGYHAAGREGWGGLTALNHAGAARGAAPRADRRRRADRDRGQGRDRP
jgi:hypothetical protein